MDDLSHWDFASYFSGYEAAALILGVEPTDASKGNHRVKVVQGRLHDDYMRSRTSFASDFDRDELFGASRDATLLRSKNLFEMRDAPRVGYGSGELSEWFSSLLSSFDFQKFARAEVASWIDAVKMTSVYDFGQLRTPAGAPVRETVEVDPSDLPHELQVANLAFRAVTNGYGGSDGTFKNRLIEYLETNYADLGGEAVKRIATVANPDKEPGRKRRGQEKARY